MSKNELLIDCVGLVIPDEYRCVSLLTVFRRANTIASLDLMYERKQRDVRSLDMPLVHNNAYLIEVYRAYLSRTDEIEQGKYVTSKLNAVVAPKVQANSRANSKPASVKSSRKPGRVPKVVIETPAEHPRPTSRPSFAEAEKALQAELARI